LDNDGWLDVFIANGHVYPQVDAIPGGIGYRQPLQAFRNNHDGSFTDISAASGLSQMPLSCRRGLAFGDVNNDGNLDVLALNVGEPPSLLLNQNPANNHRVSFKLVGTKSNRAAIGARITVRSGSLTQIDEVRGGGSYISQNDLRRHFGLGAEDKMSSVEISWPSGTKEVLRDIAADYIYTVVEGSGVRDRIAMSSPPVSKAPKLARNQ
ncbi:MAG TPA: CRTAC1 family protein, partial [Terriglobales bacterium]|nr:CRTAC1 family protein [Terriglobales bacterium]